MEFLCKGLVLLVVTNNDKMGEFGIPSWMPSAVCDRSDNSAYQGKVYVTDGFWQLPETVQSVLLTHEAGHVACGHLDLEVCQGDDLVINEVLEAQADAWAVAVVSEEKFDAALRECGELIARTINADEATIALINESIEKRISDRKKLGS
jgi:Zn-dependent protease with chaperone function